jgi:hypothetical protein
MGNSQTVKISWWGIPLRIGNSQTVNISWWGIPKQPTYKGGEFPDSQNIMVGNFPQDREFPNSQNIMVGNSQTVRISWWGIPLRPGNSQTANI